MKSVQNPTNVFPSYMNAVAFPQKRQIWCNTDRDNSYFRYIDFAYTHDKFIPATQTLAQMKLQFYSNANISYF